MWRLSPEASVRWSECGTGAPRKAGSPIKHGHAPNGNTGNPNHDGTPRILSTHLHVPRLEQLNAFARRFLAPPPQLRHHTRVPVRHACAQLQLLWAGGGQAGGRCPGLRRGEQ